MVNDVDARKAYYGTSFSGAYFEDFAGKHYRHREREASIMP